MPSNVMTMDKDRGGMGCVYIWDELAIDRAVTWMMNSDGVEHQIAAAGFEVRRIDKIENSSS